MGTNSRLKSNLSKAISILVIFINLALVTFIWVVQDDLSSSAVTIFAELDNIAQTMRNGIARVELPISNLRDLIIQVETASQEAAQNVSEAGIIPRLLPQTLIDSLGDSSQSLQDNFIAVNDLLAATSDLLLVVDAIPFVDIPEKGLSTITALQSTMQEITDQVEALRTMVSNVRGEVGETISKISTAAALLGSTAEEFQADLIQIDSDLEAVQISVRKYQGITPPVILSSAILFSLLSGWVVYSQVILISRFRDPEHEKNNHLPAKQPPPLDEKSNS